MWIKTAIWLYFELKIRMWNALLVNNNDGITIYQISRYVSSNEAVWRIFSFSIHERDLAVLHLATHVENCQHVYFTSETAVDHATSPPKTTFTEFFELCNGTNTFSGFARTLLYSELRSTPLFHMDSNKKMEASHSRHTDWRMSWFIQIKHFKASIYSKSMAD